MGQAILTAVGEIDEGTHALAADDLQLVVAIVLLGRLLLATTIILIVVIIVGIVSIVMSLYNSTMPSSRRPVGVFLLHIPTTCCHPGSAS